MRIFTVIYINIDTHLNISAINLIINKKTGDYTPAFHISLMSEQKD